MRVSWKHTPTFWFCLLSLVLVFVFVFLSSYLYLYLLYCSFLASVFPTLTHCYATFCYNCVLQKAGRWRCLFGPWYNSIKRELNKVHSSAVNEQHLLKQSSPTLMWSLDAASPGPVWKYSTRHDEDGGKDVRKKMVLIKHWNKREK